jgi:hypothetical protein
LSLIVAEATESGSQIVSDTHVTFPDGSRSSYKTGTLKAIIVDRHTAICFAGDVVSGLKGVREFAKGLKDGLQIDNLLTDLQQLTANDRRAVEFIVATGNTGAQLSRIRDGNLEQNLGVAWIGDRDGFERFQRERHQPSYFESLMGSLLPAETRDMAKHQFVMMESQLPPAARAMSKLQFAIRAVIDDPTIDSVDGFCVAVTYKPTGFEYLGSSFIYVGRDISIKPGDDITSKMAQPIEEGGFAVSVVEPLEPGTPALGLNFPVARLGMLYLPLEFDEAEVITDISPNDFARAVYERFGVRMKDPNLRYRD